MPNLSDTFGTLLNDVGSGIASAQEAFANQVTEIHGRFSDAINSATQSISEAITDAETRLDEAAQSAEQVVQDVESGINEATESVEQAASDVQSEVEGAVDEAVTSGEQLAADVENELNNAQQTFENEVDGLKDSVQQQLDEAAQEFETQVNELSSTMENAANDAVAQFEEAEQEIKEAVTNGVNDVKATVTNAIEEAKTAVEQGINDAKQAVEDGVNEVKETVTGAIEDTKNTITDAISNVGDIAESGPEMVKDIAESGTGMVKDIVESGTGMVKDVVQSGTDMVKDVVQSGTDMVTGVVEAGTGMVSDIVESGTSMVSDVVESGTGMVSDIVASGTGMVSGIVESGTGMVSDIVESGTGMVSDIVESGTSMVSDIVESGTSMVSGIVESGTSMVSGIVESGTGMVSGIVESGTGMVSGIIESGTGMVEDVIGAGTGMVEDVIGAGTGMVEGIVDAGTEMVEGVTGAADDLLGGGGDDSSGGGNQELDENLSQFFIKVDGSSVPVEVMDDIVEITVESNMHLPDMFTIHMHDSSLKWASFFEVGSSIEIAAQTPKQGWRDGSGSREVLIDGEINGVEQDMFESGVPTLLVRGFDRAYRLHQGKQTRSFDNSTVSEIVSKIAGEVGLQANVEPTEDIKERVPQNNKTNMEFLTELAKLVGYDLSVQGSKLNFLKGDREPEPGPTLEWGETLTAFRPSVSSVHQVSEVEVRGYDSKTKQAFVAMSGGGGGGGGGGIAGAIAGAVGAFGPPQIPSIGQSQKGFKGSDRVVVSRPVESQSEAQRLADTIFAEMSSSSLNAEGTALGDPSIKAGTMVTIKGMGDQFDGTYPVSVATHVYSTEETYYTEFTIGGRKPETIQSLLMPEEPGHNPGKGLMIGLVTNNNDPEGLGRVKVKYPSLSDVDESPWARIVSPFAGVSRGFEFLPEVNDEVAVYFEQGDIQRPMILGMVWNGVDKPPRPNSEVTKDGKVLKRLIRTRFGHEIMLDDTDGAEEIYIIDGSGKNKIIIQSSGIIEIESEKEINVKTKDMKIEASKTVTIQAAQKISLVTPDLDMKPS